MDYLYSYTAAPAADAPPPPVQLLPANACPMHMLLLLPAAADIAGNINV